MIVHLEDDERHEEGFYFLNEVYMYEGPYKTELEAEIAEAKYLHWLSETT